jgi:two-component system, sensor histidine kinase RegB
LHAAASPSSSWVQPVPPGIDDKPCAAFQGLRMLGVLRVFAPLAQALTLLIVTQRHFVTVPMAWLGVVLLVELVVAAATWLRLNKAPHVSTGELFLQVHLDIVLFTLVLYLTGGGSNPFAPLFVLPIAIATAALPPNRVWLVTLSTMAAYLFVRHWHIPLSHPQGLTEVYDLHENGMVANYLFTAALVAFFGIRMNAVMRRHERVLADARDTQMRNESVVAIGALAAGYAHELSSPLATMAVVVSELKREPGQSAALLRNLLVIEDQIQRSKQIISNLTHAGGQRRTEAASGARLDQFIRAITDQARALHPDASIGLQLDAATEPPWVIAEETLRQAITNLIDNAVQASALDVEVRADWSTTELQVEVRDDGPGFSPQALNQLGKQAGTTKAHRGALGVGLLLSAATLERLGGRLEFTNEPAGGARARVRVPLSSILIGPPHQHAIKSASHESRP